MTNRSRVRGRARPPRKCASTAAAATISRKQFPLIAEALERLRPQSFIIDGEAVARDGDGMPCFDRLRYRRRDASVILFAFDLIELNGDDLRRNPIERRKAKLTKIPQRFAEGSHGALHRGHRSRKRRYFRNWGLAFRSSGPRRKLTRLR